MGYDVSDVVRAECLARSAHYGQVDKAGVDYIGHPERVASRMEDEKGKIVAWLHDVVEDADVSLKMIHDAFGDEIAEAVSSITHRKGESWSDYLCRVKGNEIAKRVKISDLIDNSNLSRLPVVKEKDVLRQAKYNRALMFLMETDGE